MELRDLGVSGLFLWFGLVVRALGGSWVVYVCMRTGCGYTRLPFFSDFLVHSLPHLISMVMGN